jgi:hypothetical protein
MLLPSTGGSTGRLAGGGSAVTYVSPDGAHASVVVETAVAGCDHCSFDPSTTAATAPQQLVITVQGDALVANALKDGGLQVGRYEDAVGLYIPARWWALPARLLLVSVCGG